MGVTRDHHRFSKRVTRTKRWKTLRMQIVERDGFRCRSCGCAGRLEVDHIKPVRTDPELAYKPTNLQSLCPSCHTRKTRIECGHKETLPEVKEWRAAVASMESVSANWSIPFRLEPSRVAVHLVCGPPASGKTTYCREQAKPADLIIDFDDYLVEVGARPWDSDPVAVRAAFKLRDAAIRSLAERQSGTAWLIVSAPSDAERREWSRQLGRCRVTVLSENPEICKARIRADPERQHAADEMCAAVDKWWTTHAAARGKPSSIKWSK